MQKYNFPLTSPTFFSYFNAKIAQTERNEACFNCWGAANLM